MAKLSLTRLAMYKWKKAIIINLPAIAAKLQELADRCGVGLTPHAVAVDGALAAVAWRAGRSLRALLGELLADAATISKPKAAAAFLRLFS